jgi:hypothetical protein
MPNGFLHGLEHNVAMKPRRFSSLTDLDNFLSEQIGADENARKDFLQQLDLTHHGTMNEVWLSEEKQAQLGL